jgi:homoserine dehydrogenase
LRRQMKIYNVCIIGFGSIGRALVTLLIEKREDLRNNYDVDWRLTGVATRRFGWIANIEGLDAEALLRGEIPEQDTLKDSDVHTWLSVAQADVLFELSSLNISNGQPAIEHLRAALERGAYAITANKGPIVYGYKELQALAHKHHTRFMHEGAVMGGLPLFALFRETLPVAKLLGFRGLLNATSNVILAEMEQGTSFDEAVRLAQERGVAETDPSNDIDGWDATFKLCAIATVLFGVPLQPEQVERTSIRDLSPEQIEAAHFQGKTYRSVGRLERLNDGLRACVRPELLERTDPLVVADAATLISHFELDVIPGLTLILGIPPDADIPRIVAYDVMADWLRALPK